MRIKIPRRVQENYHQKNTKTIKLTKIRDGSTPVIITIDGFLNEGVVDVFEWEIGIKDKYSYNAWYHLEWQSENLKKFLKRMYPIFAKLIPLGAVPFASIVTIPLIGLSMPGVIKTWVSALKESEKVGKLLSKELIEFEFDEFILIGHSLGSRVIYNCLEELQDFDTKIIYDIHLLGGAVSNKSSNWLNAEKTVKNTIYNYFSYKDRVLQTAYRLGTFDSNPIGRTEIESNKTRNIDVTKYVNSHLTFKKTFFKYIQ